MPHTGPPRGIFDASHEMFRTSVRQFVEREVTPHIERWESDGVVDRELFAAAGAAGFLGMDVDERDGGGGISDFRFNMILGEELMAAGAGGAGLALTLHNDICMPYFSHTTDDEQRARWLPGICAGTSITAVAMTEPGAGSDLASIATTAVRSGDDYLVNGSKTFITNGINADLVITAVKTDPGQRHSGVSLLVLERGMPGFERGRNLDKIGLHSQDTAELFFSDVRVPVANRLGDENDSPRGRLYLMKAVVEGRLDPASDAFHTHIDRCLGCRACETACPSGVPYGQLLEATRATLTARHPLPLPARALLGVFMHPRQIGRAHV